MQPYRVNWILPCEVMHRSHSVKSSPANFPNPRTAPMAANTVILFLGATFNYTSPSCIAIDEA